jgi:Na+-driven multidrug efflux pump
VQKVTGTVKDEVLKNIKAMFMHKIGYLLVNTVDSVVISTFVGVVALGEYSNYTMVLTSMTEVLKLAFTSLTSVIGHLYVEASKAATKKYSEMFHLLNFMLGMVFFLGYYAVIDDLIAILFSSDLLVGKSVSFVITLNGFVQFMRQSTLLFREATGTFYNDRWKPLFEGLTNIVLSILFVHWIGVAGVILATIFTNLLICHVIEPFVLYRNAFLISPRKYYLKNYGMMGLFAVALVVLQCCMQSYDSWWMEFFVNGFISLGISGCICVIVLLANRNVSKELLQEMNGKLKR